jgi:pimeloyl-ACP methyl ester carboxylesterase
MEMPYIESFIVTKTLTRNYRNDPDKRLATYVCCCYNHKVPTNKDFRIKLKGNRSIGFTEFGDPKGKPVFFFHGWIGSRLDFAPNDTASKAAKARVIAVDRPGCGISDQQPNRTMLDWPNDVAELADNLGFEQFAVLGHSFGGPFVVACAYKIPERITNAGIVAGIAPFNRPGATAGLPPGPSMGLWMAGKLPAFFLKPYMWQMQSMLRKPEMLAKGLKAQLPKTDADLVSRSENRGVLDNMAEMFRPGTDGAISDAKAFARPWGFRPEDVKIKVNLWYGEADRNVPLQMGKYYQTKFQHCEPVFYPGEGHFIIYSHAQEILEKLII